MSSTIWADVLDKLYDLTVAETFIAAEIEEERLQVLDGPAINDFSCRSILTLGGLPVNDDEVAITSEWNWAAMGVNGTNADVDDLISVPCGISTMIGESDQRAARRIAIDIYSAVAQLVRGDAMSTALPRVMWCMPTPTSLRPLNTADGAEIVLGFTIFVRTRI